MQRCRTRRLGLAALASLLAVGGSACGGAPISNDDAGLQFERLRPPADAEVAPLEPYPTRAGTLGVRRYGGGSEWVVVLLHGSGYHGSYLAGRARSLAQRADVVVATPADVLLALNHPLSAARAGFVLQLVILDAH